jgi:predicted Zn-dependent protease
MTDTERLSWRSLLLKPLIAAVVGIVALALIVACATAPLTGRTQLSLISDSQILSMSNDQYREVIGQSTLSRNQKQVGLIRNVGKRVAKATEEFLRENNLGDQVSKYEWEFNLIEDKKTMNAWCMPGGKIAFYTGILPVCRDEEGVAAVMGHEVAHAVANHGRERMSQGLLQQLGAVALSVALSSKPAQTQQLFMTAYGAGTTVGLMLPFSRAQESEADRIGLTLMAKAGYDPHAAVGLWQRMRDSGAGKTPEILSTHPAPETRIKDIESHLPEAMKHMKR